MIDFFDRLAAVAKTNAPVLSQGESGTGKELVPTLFMVCPTAV
jgi:DNA-binding NtrC family response regulator